MKGYDHHHNHQHQYVSPFTTILTIITIVISLSPPLLISSSPSLPSCSSIHPHHPHHYYSFHLHHDHHAVSTLHTTFHHHSSTPGRSTFSSAPSSLYVTLIAFTTNISLCTTPSLPYHHFLTPSSPLPHSLTPSQAKMRELHRQNEYNQKIIEDMNDEIDDLYRQVKVLEVTAATAQVSGTSGVQSLATYH